jgi:hypothetical protein
MYMIEIAGKFFWVPAIGQTRRAHFESDLRASPPIN